MLRSMFGQTYERHTCNTCCLVTKNNGDVSFIFNVVYSVLVSEISYEIKVLPSVSTSPA